MYVAKAKEILGLFVTVVKDVICVRNEAYNPRHPVDCTCRECKWWWAGPNGRMQKSPVTSAPSTGLFLDWLVQPMLSYLDIQSVRLVGNACPEDSYSGSARDEVPSLRLKNFNEKGGD